MVCQAAFGAPYATEIRATFKAVGGPEIWDAVSRLTQRLVDSLS
jgi:hypothetical protein